MINELTVNTNGGAATFFGKDAEKVLQAIDAAGAKGSSWTSYIELEGGGTVMFSIDNIGFIEYN